VYYGNIHFSLPKYFSFFFGKTSDSLKKNLAFLVEIRYAYRVKQRAMVA